MPDHDENHSRSDATGLGVWRGGELTLAPCANILVAALSNRIALVDRGCRLLAANPAFLESIGRDPGESIGQPFMTLCGASDLTTLLYRHLGACLDQGRTVVEDWLETTDGGDRREHEVRLLPCHDDRGFVTGIIIEVRDVTAMREAERRLQQSAAVYAATSEGILITDPEGIVVAVNAAFTQITGYAESEILGQKPSLPDVRLFNGLCGCLTSGWSDKAV